ncbi:hypothetical protein NLJ89_g3692 [Agrocybe chaxingu]|uniref:Uncharacterized protein n=1 Tax=Agrocybe chaxingu TaxID=84603 RepID=A0A9W8K4F1_9AGAR|nr:hypothetical protein NLJ89_g3692 [Agrocybe chaxingu]
MQNSKDTCRPLYANQQFFANSGQVRLIDTVFHLHDEAPPPKGQTRINFGGGSVNFKMENSVVQTYTGSGEGVDLNAFFLQTPILPRDSRAYQ